MYLGFSLLCSFVSSDFVNKRRAVTIMKASISPDILTGWRRLLLEVIYLVKS
ncbi:hypothetical protein BRDCF_p1721 [Bacteroidales bacterium CF]|nr:hypothetical protein BRDCF_p1721 [Bacteroidales bacterium CF]